MGEVDRPKGPCGPAFLTRRGGDAAAARRRRHAAMPTCEQCGNDDDKALQVIQAGRTMTFDSFECAIQVLEPPCAHCGVRIVGHRVEEGGRVFCCTHCA
jgi:hypothetical protein